MFQDSLQLPSTNAYDQRYMSNSLYDPLYETGGGSPTYFTHMMNVYARYHVDSVDIQASLKTTGVDVLFAIIPTPSSLLGSFTTLDGMLELPSTTWERCTDNGNPAVLIGHYLPAQIDNVSPVANYVSYSGTLNSNPAFTPLLHVLMRSANGSSNMSGELVVRLTYHATLYGSTIYAD